MFEVALRSGFRDNGGVYLAAALQLREGDRSRLEALTRMSTAPAGLVQRARILLLAAEGVSNTNNCHSVGVFASDGAEVA